MNTNAKATEELRKAIHTLRESLFKGLTSSLDELDEFFKEHVKSGRIDSGYESKYEELLDEFKEQLNEFCHKIENIKF